MKLSLFLSSLLLLGVSLDAKTPVAAESSGSSSSVRPPDFQWWRDARFGMFIHWGPAALTGKEISWSRKGTGIEKYDALYKEFNPVKFNAAEWVATAKAAGMKYMVLTAKHRRHDHRQAPRCPLPRAGHRPQVPSPHRSRRPPRAFRVPTLQR